MVSAIILASGRGARMNISTPKQYLDLGGRPLLSHTLTAMGACNLVDEILIVIPEKDFDFCTKKIIPQSRLSIPPRLVAGGMKRQESVYNGIRAVNKKSKIIVIHDGVRPFIQPKQIKACIAGAKEFGACIQGIPAYDTLKKTSDLSWITHTLTRKGVWLAQTPQAFSAPIIKKAHENALRKGFTGTDDASLVELLGEKVKIVNGSKFNIKITDQEDLELAEAIMRYKS